MLKNFFKCCLFVICFPFILIFNPFFTKGFKKFISVILSLYYSFYFSKNFLQLSVNGKQRFIGKRHCFVFKGRTSFGKQNRIECITKYKNQTFNPILTVGNNVSFGDRCHIGCCNSIQIGDNCLIGSNVLIEDHSHGDYRNGSFALIKAEQNLFSKPNGIIIGKNVWIGDNVCILSGVNIGDNSVIGAGSVVTHDVESNSVCAGVPAKKIR
jgi:acetyltransferase-like isoleucine patch superfamily enzyme